MSKENKSSERAARNAKQAMEFERTLQDADAADALYMMSLYESSYNDMTLQGVKSRVKEK